MLDCTYVDQPEKLIALRLNALQGDLNTFYISSRSRLLLVHMGERKKETIETFYVVPFSPPRVPTRDQYSRIMVDTTFPRRISLHDIVPPSLRISIADECLPSPFKIGNKNWGFLVFGDSKGNACQVVVAKQKSDALGLWIDPFQKNYESSIAELDRLKAALPGNTMPDRMFWQHPEGKWWISAMLKRRVVDGEKVTMLVIGEDVV